MNATIRLGRIFGIDVGMNWSLLLIAGLLAFGLTGGQPSAELWVVAILTVVLFFASLLLHELAHSVVARHHGMTVRGITLWLLGGVAQLGGRMPSARAELQIAGAGPATSLGLAGAFGGLTVLATTLGIDPLWVSGLEWLALTNVILAVFNLIPAAPLDGGRILAGALWAIRGDQHRAEIVATRTGQLFGYALVGFGLLGTFFQIGFGSLWTVLLGWFVITAASGEQRHARLASNLDGLRVRDVMTRAPETVRGWMTVEAFADDARTHPPRHRVLPVEAWTGGIAGVVALERLAAVPPSHRASTRVMDVAFPMSSVVTARPDDSLVEVLERPAVGPGRVVLVFDGDSLVGIVTPADVERASHAGLRAPVEG